MIEIKCVAADAAAALCAQVGASATVVLEMTERQERLGFACVVYEGEEANVTFLRAPDTALKDALLRAALNTARGAGMKTASTVYEPLVLHMKKKGYWTDSSPVQVEIANFFAKSACKV